MDPILGVGVPVGGDVTGGFDFWPPFYLLMTLLLIRFVVGARLTVFSAVAAFFAGTIWFWLVGAIGVIPSAAWAVLAAIASSAIRRRFAGRPRFG